MTFRQKCLRVRKPTFAWRVKATPTTTKFLNVENEKILFAFIYSTPGFPKTIGYIRDFINMVDEKPPFRNDRDGVNDYDSGHHRRFKLKTCYYIFERKMSDRTLGFL